MTHPITHLATARASDPVIYSDIARVISLRIYYYFFKPSKNEGREKIEKVKKNGEANVPSGRPTQNYCATKQN